MQEYSKIRTFLIRRKDNKPCYPSRDLSPSLPEQIMIPAIAYKVCLTKSSVPDNIVSRTVVDLASHYEHLGYEHGKILDIVAERTKLDRILVKAILKRHQNTLDAETGEENDGLIQEFYYVLYDPIAQNCFPDLISAEQFEADTRFEETSASVIDLKKETPRFSFKFAMNESKWFSASVLNYTFNNADVPADPKAIYSPKITNKYLRSSKNKLEYLGISETVGVIIPCYISGLDLSKIHVMNPIGKGSLDHLIVSIKSGIIKYPSRNEEIGNCINELDGKRKMLLDKVNTFADATGETKKRLLISYPTINQYPQIWERMATVEATFDSYIKSFETGSEAALSGLNEIGKDFVLAFYGAMEQIFSLSVVKNYPKEKITQMEALVAPLLQTRNHSAYFVGIAEQVGFDDIDVVQDFFLSPEVKIKIKVLQRILAEAFSGGNFPESLPELVVAHMVQAAASEEHPFRLAIVRCPKILQTVKRFLSKRNAVKHGNNISEVNGFLPERREINEMRVLVETMLDVLLVPCADFEALEQNEADINNRQAAQIKAEDEIKDYPSIADEREAAVFETAKKVCYRFHYKDPEYFSECSNLLSVMIDVLLKEFTVYYQRVTASAWFDGNKNSDDNKIHELFMRYNCDYTSSDKPQTAKIKVLIKNPSRMTLKCKFYLAVVTLDKEKPDFLKRVLTKVSEMPALIDRVCVERLHNSMTDFSAPADGYESFHEEFLDTCNTFFGVLKGGE